MHDERNFQKAARRAITQLFGRPSAEGEADVVSRRGAHRSQG
jgi:hypothetical protein